jgi:NAD(P) transhydrogenase subunit alpha
MYAFIKWSALSLLLTALAAAPVSSQEAAPPTTSPAPTTTAPTTTAPTTTAPTTTAPTTTAPTTAKTEVDDVTPSAAKPKVELSSKTVVMLAGLTVFVLSIFVGFEIITKVPATLHTPLMSGSNAISGITLVGAVIVAGGASFLASTLGMLAVILATINVVGGFLVTHRMLAMFKKR